MEYDARRSLHGERGLKPVHNSPPGRSTRRSLHGERGLKHPCLPACVHPCWSLPSWGAWIETQFPRLKTRLWYRRSLHGERGLKHNVRRCRRVVLWSLPSWGAWIETFTAAIFAWIVYPSLPSWGAWIETIHKVEEPSNAPRRSLHGERGLKRSWMSSHQPLCVYNSETPLSYNLECRAEENMVCSRLQIVA